MALGLLVGYGVMLAIPPLVRFSNKATTNRRVCTDRGRLSDLGSDSALDLAQTPA